MNSISRSVRGILILVVAVVIGTAVLSKTVKTSTASEPSVPTESSLAPTIPETVPVAPVRDPKTVKVLVANGSKVNGAARRARNCLISSFDAVAPVDVSQPKPLPTAIYVQAGYESEGQAVAASLSADVIPTPTPASLPVTPDQAAGINIIVVVGTDLATSVKNLPCAETPTATATATVSTTTVA